MKRSDIKIEYITQEESDVFSPLMLPDDARKLKAGMPVVAFGAVIEGVAVGAICGEAYGDSTFSVSSFYVSPEYRGRGVGSFLLEELIVILPEYITVLLFDYIKTDSNHAALDRFLEHHGAKLDKANVGLMRVKVSQLCDSEFYNHGYHKGGVKVLDELTKDHIYDLENFTRENALPQPNGGFLAKEVYAGCSVVMQDYSGIMGYIIIDDEKDGVKSAASVYFEEKSDLAALFMGLIKALEENCSRGEMIYFPVVDVELGDFIMDVFPKVVNIERRWYYRI
ncbi:MAG: GNAT family N-acetyltransferase [Lachnospiraceae bacterium]|nr:GNAT family N-acetyltransferase [Lachnospiraceae bacterium]